MEGKFDVTMGGRAIGTAELSREGLYCRIRCRCAVADGGIHRLYADGEKIGVLIPQRGELVLETKVAAKRLREGCRFSLDGETAGFVPIRPGEPFPYLHRLRTGRLALRGGELGVLLGEPAADFPPRSDP